MTTPASPDQPETPNDRAPHQAAKAQTNRWTLVALLLLFAAPPLIAQFLLSTGLWKTQGSTEHGDRLETPVALVDLNLRTAPENIDDTLSEPWTIDTLNGTWGLFLTLPQHCDASCENGRYLLHQIIPALGPEQKRVQALWVYLDASTVHDVTAHANTTNTITTDPAETQPDTQALDTQPAPLIAYGTSTQFTQAFAAASKGEHKTSNQHVIDTDTSRLYIMDPLGNIMLSYPIPRDKNASILFGRGILIDLKKLLKLSRIG